MNPRLIRPAVALALTLSSLAPAPENIPDAGRSYRVPYRLTDTNHILVRARVNGKGPFNLVVDTGAPAFFLATEAAEKAGLDVKPGAFWTAVDRLDVEGGATLHAFKARVEDPAQLVGMNALGLPGARIDGLLGYSALARYRIELDPTRDRMTWTRLDFSPKEPPEPKRKPGDQPLAEMRMMNAIGSLTKVAAAFVGKQPEDELSPRGFLGLVLDGPRVARVLEGSPAAKAGLREGDRLVRLAGHDVASAKDARDALAAVRPGDAVVLSLRRDAESLDLTLTAAEGF